VSTPCSKVGLFPITPQEEKYKNTNKDDHQIATDCGNNDPSRKKSAISTQSEQEVKLF
jgi:hypothetical protein